MNTKKCFECAAIFSEADVKNDFISCVASTMERDDDVIILVEGQNGIIRIAEVVTTYESGGPIVHLQVCKNIAEQYGIDAEMVESSLNMAAIIRDSAPLSITESINVVAAIAKNYNISRK